MVLMTLSAGAGGRTELQRVVPYGATKWQYKEVPHGNEPNFQKPDYAAAGFKAGRAAFGDFEYASYCENGSPRMDWNYDTDLLLRRTVTIPAGATGLKINGAISPNNVSVKFYLNGKLLGQREREEDPAGECVLNDAVTITAPKSTLKPTSVLAIRASATTLIPTYADFAVFAILPDTDATVKLTFTNDLDTSNRTADLKVTLSSSRASCANGASVVVRKEGTVIKRGKTNASGAFAFSVQRTTGPFLELTAFAPGGEGCDPSRKVTISVPPYIDLP